MLEHTQSDVYAYLGYYWTQAIPSPDASEWYCKYHISAERDLVNKENPDDRGYIYLEVEPYAFDEDVFIIIQPHKGFYDYNPDCPHREVTTVLRATFGSRFLIPAEYDILLSFMPTGNSPDSLFA